MRRRALAAVVVGSLLAACSSGPTDAGAGGRLGVVTTVSPITNIVENIGGAGVQVTGIVPEGTNSHTFEPRPSDARLLATADVVFVNGLGLEEPTMDLARASVQDGVEIVKLADRTIGPDEFIFDFSFPKAQGDPNPHLWTHPLYARDFAKIVRDKLSALRPADTATFEQNYRTFADRIRALDRAVRTVTRSVPQQNRKLLTYHDSFPYFARHYGWKIVGAIQPSDFSEPTPREVKRLIDQIESERVPAIFGSEVFPSPVLEQIASEAGARYVDDLRDDDLPGDPGDPDHSYLGLMVFDFKTFMGALGGDTSALDEVDTANIMTGAQARYRG